MRYSNVFLEMHDLYVNSTRVGYRLNVALVGRRLLAFDGESISALYPIQERLLAVFKDRGWEFTKSVGAGYYGWVEGGVFVTEDEDLVYTVNSPMSEEDYKEYCDLIEKHIVELLAREKILPVTDYRIDTGHPYNPKKWEQSGFSHKLFCLMEDGKFVGHRIQFYVNNEYICSVDSKLYESILSTIRDEFYYRRWRFSWGKVEPIQLDGKFENNVFVLLNNNIPSADISVLASNKRVALPVIMEFLHDRLYPAVSRKVAEAVKGTFDIPAILNLFGNSGEGLFKYADRFGEPYNVYSSAKSEIPCLIRAYAKSGRKDNGKVYVECYFITLGDYVNFIYNCLKLLKRDFLIDQTYFASVGGKNAKKRKVSCNCSKEAFSSLMCKVWGVPTNYLSTRAGSVKLLGENEFGVLSVVEMKGVNAECFCLKSSFDVKNIHEFEE